jgi:hypothetical protein
LSEAAVTKMWADFAEIGQMQRSTLKMIVGDQAPTSAKSGYS